MDYAELTDRVLQKLDQKLSGKNLGMTSGFKKIDELCGRLQHGQLVLVGGSSGVGKSYFILNMIKGMLQEKEDLRVAIFSTELSDEDYLIRYACLLSGIYKIQLQTKPKEFVPLIRKTLIRLYEDKVNNPNTFDIFGEVYSLEDIKTKLDTTNYDICFIDYVQELTAKGKYDVKETMPVIAKELKKTALETKTVIVAVSQVNNYALTQTFNLSNSNQQPFAFGKELVQAAHIALSISRVKKEDKQDSVLQCRVTKARDGELGLMLFNIRPGYNLDLLDEVSAIDYYNRNLK